MTIIERGTYRGVDIHPVTVVRVSADKVAYKFRGDDLRRVSTYEFRQMIERHKMWRVENGHRA